MTLRGLSDFFDNNIPDEIINDERVTSRLLPDLGNLLNPKNKWAFDDLACTEEEYEDEDDFDQY